MFNAGTVMSYLVLNTDKFKKGMNEAQAEVKAFAQTTGGYGNKMRAFSNMLSSVGKKAMVGVTVPLAGIATAATKTAMSFEAGMSKVQAISGASGEQMKLLEAKAREMGATTKFSATEAAEAMQYMGMAGWKTDQMLAGIPGIMDLAAASGEDLATVSDIVTDSLSGFGLKAEDTTKFVDLLAKTATSSNTNVSMMGETFKYIAPLFGSLGYNAEDASLALGLMANSGIKAGKAGTALRGAITRLINPTKTSAAWMDRLGISVTDSQGNMLPFRDLLVSLRGKFANLSEEQKAQAASAIFGQEAMSGMLAIMNASEEDFNNLAEATLNYTGAASEMAEIMEDNLQGELTKLKSALEELGISIGNALIPLIKNVVQKLQEWTDKFNGLDDTTKQTIVQIGLFVMSIAPVMLILSKLISTFDNVITVGTRLARHWGSLLNSAKTLGAGLKSILGVALNPWTLAIGGAIAAGILIVKNWDFIKAAASKLGSWISSKFDKIGSDISNTWNSAKSATSNAWNTMSSYVSQTASQIAQSIPQFFRSIPSIMGTIGTNIMQGLHNGIVNAANNVIQSIANIANSITSTFRSLLDIHSPSRVFKKYGQYIDQGLAQGIEDGEDDVIKELKKVVDSMKKHMNDNISFLNEVGDAIMEALRKQYGEQEEIQQKALDKQLNNEKKASDDRLKVYNKEYTEKLKLLDEETYNKLKEIQNQIDGIDKQTEKEEKALKKQQYLRQVDDLKQQIRDAKNAKERAKLQERLTDLIQKEQRNQLLEQRKLQKQNLKEQMDDIKDQQSQKKKQLKEELEDRKKAEKEKLKIITDELAEEKSVLKEHYKELTSKENLQMKARKMMINKEQDKIIKLLKDYNPKWQDAGQSFADSLIHGLNSEHQSIDDAIKNSLDLTPTINEQINAIGQLEAAIDKLQNEQEKKSKQKAKSAGGGGKGLKGAKGAKGGGGILGGAKKGIDDLGISAQSAGEKLEQLTSKNADFNGSLKTSTESVDLFGEGVSKGTQRAVGSFLKMNDDVTATLTYLNWSGLSISSEMSSSIVKNFETMREQVVGETEKEKKLAIHHLNGLFKESKTITAEEQANILKMTTKSYDERIDKTNKAYDRMIQIITEAGKENRKLTAAEKEEINRLQEEQKENAIDILSKSKEEQAIIMTQLKQEGEKISAEQAANIVKYSKEQKDKTVKNAEKEYRERLRHAQQLRDEGSEESMKLADKVEEEAKRQKDEAVRQAEDMHNEVVGQARKQAGEHVNEIDWETGEVKGKWDKLKDFFSKTILKREVKTKDDEGDEKAKNKWTSLKDWFKNNPISRHIKTLVSGKEPAYNATGTDHWRGGLTWVGEHGKELVDLPKGSKIYNHNKSSDIASNRGGGIVQNIEIHSPKALSPSEIARKNLQVSRQLAMEWRV